MQLGGGGLVAKSSLTLVTPWTVACRAPLSMGFSRQEYWSGLLFPSPEDLPHPDIKPGFPTLQADSLHTELHLILAKRPRSDIHWIIEKSREFQKDIYFCFIDYAKAFDCVDQKKLENYSRDGDTRAPYLPPEKPACRSRCNS